MPQLLNRGYVWNITILKEFYNYLSVLFHIQPPIFDIQALWWSVLSARMSQNWWLRVK